MTEYGIYFILLCAAVSIFTPVFIAHLGNKNIENTLESFDYKRDHKKRNHLKRIKRKNKRGF